MQAKDKITRARAGLILDQAFFGALALRQVLREDPSIKTADTDGHTIRYNPTFVDGLSLAQVKGLLAHEVMHVAAGHHARRQKRNAAKWNIACDYAINDLLIASGFQLPDGKLAGYGTDKSAEEIYSQLPDQPEDPNGKGDSDPGGCGGISDAPGPDGRPASPSELAEAEANARVAVSQAAAAAKKMGQLPGALARLVEEIMDPSVPWREILRRFITETARNDYTWVRPNPRYLSTGFYLPSLYSQELAPLVIAVDTSESVGREEIAQFAAEMTAIIEDTGAQVTVMYVDSQIAGIEEFGPDSLPLVLHPHGGGGTDFRPPFVEVDKRALTPSCLVYLSDGECSRFPEAPEYPVLWAITGNRRYFKPPFGEVAEIQ